MANRVECCLEGSIVFGHAADRTPLLPWRHSGRPWPPGLRFARFRPGRPPRHRNRISTGAAVESSPGCLFRNVVWLKTTGALNEDRHGNDPVTGSRDHTLSVAFPQLIHRWESVNDTQVLSLRILVQTFHSAVWHSHLTAHPTIPHLTNATPHPKLRRTGRMRNGGPGIENQHKNGLASGGLQSSSDSAGQCGRAPADRVRGIACIAAAHCICADNITCHR